jgi:hypothetical protein
LLLTAFGNLPVLSFPFCHHPLLASFLFRFSYSGPYVRLCILGHLCRLILILSSLDSLLGMASCLVYYWCNKLNTLDPLLVSSFHLLLTGPQLPLQ